MKKSTGYGGTHASAPAESFLQGAEALSFARDFGALVHWGSGPPLTWPYANKIVKEATDVPSVWLSAAPEWPAFALQGAFAGAMSSKQSVRILAPSAECFAIVTGLLVQLTGGVLRFRRHDTGRGLALQVLEAAEPVHIYVEPATAPVFYGPLWLPTRFLRAQDDMPLQMRRCFVELMARAFADAIQSPETTSLDWLGEPTGGDDNHKK